MTALNDLDEALQLDNQFCFVLYALSRKIIAQYRPLLNELGLTYPQYLVMLVLWESLPDPQFPQGVAVKFIGERLKLDSGTLTPLLKRLESNGLIHRERASHDEREVLIRLSLDGIELKERARVVPLQLLCNLPITPNQLLALREQLRLLLDEG
ncbi:MAG: MarR family transcriptional regulator [Pseudomonadales bacterium]|nr:MarR family transcriptional regulator [Pseudomonadales bacterium]MCK5790945.1 MarR family transcriptional regulator [Ketobacter sp.]MEC8810821.1 MarR family transcriptional regulator [Pseudomonadota bacterium]TNC89543.1 MAG: MarR family transcriptional regulator [Alcanivorax sp.]HAG95176.1 MarR family transcriptional regulator [Gammaproteobacteria bacterium]